MKTQLTSQAAPIAEQDPYSLDRLCVIDCQSTKIISGKMGLGPAIVMCFHLATDKVDFSLNDFNSGNTLLRCTQGNLLFKDPYLAPYYFAMGKAVDLHTEYFLTKQFNYQKEAHEQAQRALVQGVEAFYVNRIEAILNSNRQLQERLDSLNQAPQEEIPLSRVDEQKLAPEESVPNSPETAQ